MNTDILPLNVEIHSDNNSENINKQLNSRSENRDMET